MQGLDDPLRITVGPTGFEDDMYTLMELLFPKLPPHLPQPA
jgi:hypothetical protein